MHNPNEIIEIYRYIEEKFDLSKFNYRGVNFWPVIRKQISFSFYRPELNKNESVFLREKTISYYLKRPNTLFRSFLLKKKFIASLKPLIKKVQVCAYPESLFIDNIEGKAYSRHIDPYYEVIKEQYPDVNRVSFSKGSSKLQETYYPVEVHDMFAFFEYINFESYLRTFDSDYIKEVKKMHTIFEEVNALVYEKFSIKPFYKNLVKSFNTVIEYSIYFDHLFERSTVKLIFIECYYDSLKMGISVAAKKHNIKVIEIQHGVIKDNSYIPYTNHNIDYEVLPNHIWCWSPSDVSLLLNENKEFNLLKPFLGGNMWLKKFINSEITFKNKKTESFFLDIKTNYTKVILVTLQPVFILHDVIIETIKAAPVDYMFLIRFHPYNTEKEIKDLKEILSNQDNVEFDNSSSFNLYELFKNSDFQITHSSATAIEALTFALPTIVCSSYGYDFYSEQIDCGVILYSEDSKEIIKLLKEYNFTNNHNTKYYTMNTDVSLAKSNLSKAIGISY